MANSSASCFWVGSMSTSTASPQGSAYGTRRLAKLATLAHSERINTGSTELSVSQARDHFSDAVNRAAFGGEITYVTRGRNSQRAASSRLSRMRNSWFSHCGSPIAARLIAIHDRGQRCAHIRLRESGST